MDNDELYVKLKGHIIFATLAVLVFIVAFSSLIFITLRNIALGVMGLLFMTLLVIILVVVIRELTKKFGDGW